MAETLVKYLIRRRTLLLVVAPLVALLAAHPHPTAYAIGLLLLAAGQGVRLWSTGYIVKNEQLATAGPYALVRNPLYFGSLLITLGWGSVSGGIIPAVLLLGCYFATHLPTIRKEERYLHERYGAEFEAFCRHTPRLLPRLCFSGAPAGQFSWERARRELKNARWLLLLAIAFGVKLWL